MKSMNHHLVMVAAALGLSGTAAVAQFGSAVYGTTTRSSLAVNRPEGSRPLIALNSPSNQVFGAVSTTARPAADPALPGARAIDIAGSAPTAANASVRADSAAASQNLAASAALDMTDTLHAINAATVQARPSLLGNVNARMEASDQAIAILSQHARSLHQDAQTQFNVAVKDVHAKEKALKRSLKTAGRVRAEAWVQARADLAAHFNAYAEAVAHAEAVTLVAERTVPATAPSGMEDEARNAAMVVDDR